MIPQIHAEASVKRFGGKPEDYIDIHQLMDSTKASFSNNAHRMITHNSWFTTVIIPKVFGEMRVNSDGRRYSTKDVAEYHCLEDFRMKFIPTIQDYLEHLDVQPWMNNGLSVPNRLKKVKYENLQELKTID